MAKKATRKFHLGTLLSITTGILLPGEDRSGNGIGDVYKILDFMEGHDHWTHELPAASRRMEPVLLEQHPWLAEIRPTEEERARMTLIWRAWLDKQVDRYGEWHEVKAVPVKRTKGPIQTAVELIGELKSQPVDEAS